MKLWCFFSPSPTKILKNRYPTHFSSNKKDMNNLWCFFSPSPKKSSIKGFANISQMERTTSSKKHYRIVIACSPMRATALHVTRTIRDTTRVSRTVFFEPKNTIEMLLHVSLPKWNYDVCSLQVQRKYWKIVILLISHQIKKTWIIYDVPSLQLRKQSSIKGFANFANQERPTSSEKHYRIVIASWSSSHE